MEERDNASNLDKDKIVKSFERINEKGQKKGTISNIYLLKSFTIYLP